MSKKDTDIDDDFALFRDAVQGVKKLRQDTIIQQPNRNAKQKQITRFGREASDTEFYFSDEFVPLLSEDGPTRYARDDVSQYEVKRLRRGVYVPDVFLDMHGMTQAEAKRELGAMIAYCVKNEVHCACVQHGIGKHVLKQKTPLWLAQHPDVMAFHQAPLEFGGDGALLILLSIPEK
ncbi:MULTISPECIES: endonuclease SmrB [unclassified Vibrio]|uniref:endonuclease SmrB n=1 Tax=unclassified Vibrio TaxID=2614977 RepID=UPI001361F2F0|nr:MULTISPECIES: endonuclease SmrB [unclassified Vibrio]NAW58503.1 endonuclease SmrB [Vibrio sp. V36_P2S2PM302]NAX24148.1 endonuclease SmrB [Vibrio sp. V38_P2S17PM301]NAX31347.1 endonuclease SmrB [Vibrio sp. V37_P2S8PM304]